MIRLNHKMVCQWCGKDVKHRKTCQAELKHIAEQNQIRAEREKQEREARILQESREREAREESLKQEMMRFNSPILIEKFIEMSNQVSSMESLLEDMTFKLEQMSYAVDNIPRCNCCNNSYY